MKKKATIILWIIGVLQSYIFDENHKIEDGKRDLIEHVKNIEDKDEKRNVIEFLIKENKITWEEAEKL